MDDYSWWLYRVSGMTFNFLGDGLRDAIDPYAK